ncbi:biotin--[acetyl-CoA-carboxylase] ligase [uncultured Fibrobacter sp.]|uniref:biotin--[acetyl-CoA-carboxylase] ligase n=1 Tax=uncultured Fibrobacter sp. TaxID=261512 RepID=UPI00262999A8|nr:biotin--[acetyl-CoA-carboxylase] ligase [uncultured Fibrobacter sp.]
MFSSEKNFSEWSLSGFSGAPAFLFETLESTHSLMKARAASGKIVPGTLMVADTQTAGRGRHERTWDSPAGLNLYFNILIPLDGIPLASAPQITQVAALTFAEIFKSLQDDANAKGLGNQDIGKVTVKWPNDILCGKHKFCGILAELVFIKEIPAFAGMTSTQGSPKPAISMGVGINVNSSPADYAHLGRSVTTLKDICGQKINREKLLQMLIGNLERAIGQFRAFGIRPWIAAWKRMDQFIGARGTIVVNNRCTDQNRNSGEGSIKKTGSILDMQDDGSLLFKCDDGTIETVYSADLEV